MAQPAEARKRSFALTLALAHPAFPASLRGHMGGPIHRPAAAMPKLSTKTPRWVQELRGVIKGQHGTGWLIGEQSGRVKLTRRWPDGGSNAVMLDLPWSANSGHAVINQITSIRQRMEEAGLSLAEAAQLEAQAGASSAHGGNYINSGTGIHWAAVVERFHQHKTTHTGAIKDRTWTRQYAPVMRQLLEVLSTRPIPRDGRAVLAQLRDSFGGEPGSQGRRQRILYAAQLLRFAVEECGAPQQWQPPPQADLQPFTGRRVSEKKDSTPLTDAHLLRLLEGLSNPRWRLAVGLMGCFGLRPVELRYCQPSTDGKTLHVAYRKRTSRGSTKPRDVYGLDPVGRPGLSEQLLGQLQLSRRIADAPGLPPLGSNDAATASAISTYLRRQPLWLSLRAEAAAAGEQLTVYSLRHGYALRAHEEAGLSPRVTAAQMGHSLQTHNAHYGRWTDAETVAAAMDRAGERMNARHAQHQQERIA